MSRANLVFLGTFLGFLCTFLDPFCALQSPFVTLLSSFIALLRSYLRTFNSFQIGFWAHSSVLVQNSLVTFNVLPSLRTDRHVLSFHRLLVKVLAGTFWGRFNVIFCQIVLLIFDDYRFSYLLVWAWSAINSLNVDVLVFLKGSLLRLGKGLETASVHLLRKDIPYIWPRILWLLAYNGLIIPSPFSGPLLSFTRFWTLDSLLSNFAVNLALELIVFLHEHIDHRIFLLDLISHLFDFGIRPLHGLKLLPDLSVALALLHVLLLEFMELLD